MIDPRKLVAMMRQGKPNADGYPPGAGQEHHARLGEEEELAEDEGAVDDDERLKAVGYMELDDMAGAFSCGNCTWARVEDEFCENPEVQTKVSADHGCCNLFYPAASPPAFPIDMPDPRGDQAEG